MEKFTTIDVKFTLKDVGSKIIDQLSTDVYTGPGSIVRELVKNAYDSYLGLDSEELEGDSFARQVVISRDRDHAGVGRILIADRGIGQDLSTIKGNAQISISTKPEDLQDATGFRGLGSWAVLGAGSKINIVSSKKGIPYEFRLAFDVRKIYSILDMEMTLDDILNNAECISFSRRACTKDSHFTTVEIICDGPAGLVNGHELNRLYSYTDPNNSDFRELLIENCPIPFAAEGGVYKKIHEIYSQAKYIPTALVLDGDKLERRLPPELSELFSREIHVGNQLAAMVWVVENPEKTGEAGRWIDETKHLLGGPSIQLMKVNVPIGCKGLFADDKLRTLDWYVGEVHIVAEDVLPSANGQDLRAGTAREAFIDSLRKFYQELEERAESKSEILSLERKLRQGAEAAKKIQENHGLPPAEAQHERSRVAKAVELIEEMSKKSAKGSARTTVASSAKTQGSTVEMMTLEEFQARVARAIPRFEELGLTKQQTDGVLKIIQDLFNI